MIEETKVKALAEEKIAGTDCFLVDVKVQPQNRIIVLVDKPSGVTLSDCAEMSRFIESGLERDMEDFELTVSSPGLEEPFRVMPQYEKSVGKEVSVLLYDGRRLDGRLLSVSGTGIELEIAGKKENLLNTFSFHNIKETKRVIRFSRKQIK
jgi:ribosome maturation factor RimP